MSDQDWVTWVGPLGQDSETQYCFATVADAISVQRKVAKSYGHEYESDQAALDDFMVVHWAQFCNSPLPQEELK